MSITSWFENFIKSPNNQTGLLAVAVTIPGLLTQYEAHSIGLSVLVGTIIFGVGKIVMPDNIALVTDAEKFVEDGLVAIASRNPQEISILLSDAAKVASDIRFTTSGVTSVSGVV